MGRLDDIIDRNKHPRRHRKLPLPVGILLSAFVLLVLILMIFTDVGLSKSPAAAPTTSPTSGDKRIDGVLLYRAPAHRDAAAVGSAGTAQP